MDRLLPDRVYDLLAMLSALHQLKSVLNLVQSPNNIDVRGLQNIHQSNSGKKAIQSTNLQLPLSE